MDRDEEWSTSQTYIATITLLDRMSEMWCARECLRNGRMYPQWFMESHLETTTTKKKKTETKEYVIYFQVKCEIGDLSSDLIRSI